MKKLLLLLLIAPVLGFGQGEQRYVDGTATDQDGNTFEWINYESQDSLSLSGTNWAIENAKVVTYRDGTPIPQVTDATEWSNLNTGAWCYYENDSSKGKLYNWYAVVGIHDDDQNTPNKEFAPEGWRVPSDSDWSELEACLIVNSYNYDQTTTGNKIAKSMASATGWNSSTETGAIGNDQTTNNRSGINAFPKGFRDLYGVFADLGNTAYFWSSTEHYMVTNRNYAWLRWLYHNNIDLYRTRHMYKKSGFSVRFVRDAATASTKDYSNSINIYPNPTTSIINIEQDFTSAKVYDISGRELLKSTSKTIDLSELPSSIYLLRLYDNSNKVLGTSKVVKQ